MTGVARRAESHRHRPRFAGVGTKEVPILGDDHLDDGLREDLLGEQDQLDVPEAMEKELEN